MCASTTRVSVPAFNDVGTVVMAGQPKSFKDVSSVVQDVVFTRYRVTYVRADMVATCQVVDVPFPFDGVANFRVPVSGTAERSFLIVRVQAKLESPLSELSRGGGSLVISTIAELTSSDKTSPADRFPSHRLYQRYFCIDFAAISASEARTSPTDLGAEAPSRAERRSNR